MQYFKQRRNVDWLPGMHGNANTNPTIRFSHSLLWPLFSDAMRITSPPGHDSHLLRGSHYLFQQRSHLRPALCRPRVPFDNLAVRKTSSPSARCWYFATRWSRVSTTLLGRRCQCSTKYRAHHRETLLETDSWWSQLEEHWLRNITYTMIRCPLHGHISSFHDFRNPIIQDHFYLPLEYQAIVQALCSVH